MRALAVVVALVLSGCASSQPPPPPPAAGEAVKGAEAPHPCPCKAWIRESAAEPGCVELQAAPPWEGCAPYSWGYLPTSAGAVMGFRPLNEDRSRVRACGNRGIYQVHAVSASCGCAIQVVEIRP